MKKKSVRPPVFHPDPPHVMHFENPHTVEVVQWMIIILSRSTKTTLTFVLFIVTEGSPGMVLKCFEIVNNPPGPIHPNPSSFKPMNYHPHVTYTTHPQM